MDIALKYSDGLIDLGFSNQDLERDDGLRTAIIISLFTDARVSEEELPAGEVSRRGWWGDLFPDVERDKIGSRLWLLSREKQTNETLARAKQYALESLQWLIEDEIASAVNVQTSYTERGVIEIKVSVTKPEGQVMFDYSFLWDFEAARD